MKDALKSNLVETISYTSNGKEASLDTQREVLSIITELETTYPSNPMLLSDPVLATKYLNGTWYLQYTQPGTIDSNDNDNDNE
eukprot:CAMPEP_0194192040 /NCGR_PEP_ID=MMETSP0154-20130528/69047_1 /TAXON_ID=1049557 /ORGANISM="Thalassiothrix antarctica, Strain L6-D1" /LENGTH=82 /DNA_ID=CAMNT_0038915169 /DNA_START=72 /DNA_END=317 /DNA_ORIENTATION=+